MPLKLKLELFSAIIIFLYIIYKSIKNQKLSVRYSALWLFAILIMTLCVLFADSLQAISTFLGIKETSNLVFLVIVGLLIFLCFSLTIMISLQKQQIINLTQELAISNKKKVLKSERENKK